MALTDEENFLTPSAPETHRCIFFPVLERQSCQRPKGPLLPGVFFWRLAHPGGDRTRANTRCTETVLFTPRKQLACAWPLYHTISGGDVFTFCFPFPLFARSLGSSQHGFWGSLVHCKRSGGADPSEGNEASRSLGFFLIYQAFSAAAWLLFCQLILQLPFLNEQIRLALAGCAKDAPAAPELLGSSGF